MKLARLLPSFFVSCFLIASSTQLSEAFSDPSASSTVGLAEPHAAEPSIALVPDPAVGPPKDDSRHGNRQDMSLELSVMNPSQPSVLEASENGDAAMMGSAPEGTAPTSGSAAVATTTASSPASSSLLPRRWSLPPLKGISVNPRLTNLVDRTVPAVALLTLLFGVARQGGELGLRYALVAITPGLFHEATSVVAASGSSTILFSNRWFWFVAYSLMATLPMVAPASVKPELLRYAGYSASLLCWVGWILRLNAESDPQTSVDSGSTDRGESRFASAWGEIATYHMAALVALLPIHSLLSVLRAGRMDWALYASLLVICNDTFAYLVGHFVGKRPLLPVISPKKTLEGWAGALLLTTLASPLLWKQLFQQPYSVHSLHIALFGSLVAPFGGYLASTAKRAYGKKDFGTLLGSHGGLVDRLDCQLITAPYLHLFLAAIGEMQS